MAGIYQKPDTQLYYVNFCYGGKHYKRGLGTQDRERAASVKALVEDKIG